MPDHKSRIYRLLRWSEKYTKTDMVYLASVGWWTNLNVVTTSVLALLLSAAFANFLPRNVYGTYQYLLSLFALLSAICLSGMGGAVAQSAARGYDGDLRAGVRAQLRWGVVPMLIGLSGALYYFLYANLEIGLGLTIIAILTPLMGAFSIYGSYLSGRREFKRAFLYGSAVNLAYYAAIFTAIVFVKNAAFLILVNLGANVLTMYVAYLSTQKKSVTNTQTDPHTIPYGKHLSVMNAFGTVINQLDSVLVYHFLGPVQLAVYSFATMIPERVGGLLGFIGTAAFPKFANRTLTELRGSIISKTLRAAAIGGVAAVAYAVIAPELFRLIFPKYLDAIPYTQIYALVILFMASNLVSLALQAKRLKAELYLVSFINPIMLIALQVPFLLFYGIWGMLWARIISDAINVTIGIALLFRASRRDDEFAPDPAQVFENES